MKKVVAPAIKKSNGQVVKATVRQKHHDDIPAKGQRGFVLSDGTFANRGKAAKVARKSGQANVRGKRGLHSSDL